MAGRLHPVRPATSSYSRARRAFLPSSIVGIILPTFPIKKGSHQR
jgi:hypothetical protein